LLPSLNRAAVVSPPLIWPMPLFYDMQPLPPARRLRAPSGRCLQWTPHTDKPSFCQQQRDITLKAYIARVLPPFRKECNYVLLSTKVVHIWPNF
jgi:hypothetical protein